MINETKEIITWVRMSMIMTLLRVIEVNEQSLQTSGHSDRTASVAILLGKMRGFPDSELQVLWRSALLHDIGKVAIDASIIFSPFKLDDYERAEISRHAVLGYEILRYNQYLKYESMIIKQHHEYFDGTGYPDGLLGNDIHVFARIISVADTFDALFCDRPYKRGWNEKKIKNYFENQSNKMFDPDIVSNLFLLFEMDRFSNIYPTWRT